ncbi:MAG: hypothetical protein BPH43C_40 [Phage 5P_1]|nr:MAG: hypothetical protein BPH43C_40 [Phage 5P_1]
MKKLHRVLADTWNTVATKTWANLNTGTWLDVLNPVTNIAPGASIEHTVDVWSSQEAYTDRRKSTERNRKP